MAVDKTPNRYFTSGTVLYSKDDGETSSNRWTLDGRYERVITDRFFAFFEGNYLRDTLSNYDARVNLGPGLGYEFIKSERHYLRGLGSVLYSYDKFKTGGSDTYMAGKLAGEYWWQILENLKFTQKADYLQSFADSDVYFFNSDTGLELKVSTHISFGLGYIINYQNDPPGDADDTDTIFLTRLIVDY